MKDQFWFESVWLMKPDEPTKMLLWNRRYLLSQANHEVYSKRLLVNAQEPVSFSAR